MKWGEKEIKSHESKIFLSPFDKEDGERRKEKDVKGKDFWCNLTLSGKKPV